LLVGCTSEPVESATGGDVYPDAALATITSDNGDLILDVRTAPSQPPSRGTTSVDLHVTDAKGAPRDDLTLSVVPWMPDMGHGASTKPTVEAMGDGHYEVSGVSMFMPGRWELRTKVAAPINDSAKVVFQIP